MLLFSQNACDYILYVRLSAPLWELLYRYTHKATVLSDVYCTLNKVIPNETRIIIIQ